MKEIRPKKNEGMPDPAEGGNAQQGAYGGGAQQLVGGEPAGLDPARGAGQGLWYHESKHNVYFPSRAVA